ncbi:hypothetical protein HK102_010517, partial [Quaeritorhiza haematococci]
MARKRKKKDEGTPPAPAPKRPLGFWDADCDKIADRLWAPLKTNETEFTKTSTGSWFTMGTWSGTHTVLPTEDPQQLGAVIQAVGQEATTAVKKTKKNLRAKKIPIFPSKRDSELIKKWFDDARFTYNKALEIVKSDITKNKFHFNKGYFSHLRWRLVPEKRIKKDWDFLKSTPSKIRAAAIVNDLLNAFKSNFKKRKINPKHTFDVKFRSKNDIEQSISIEKNAFPKKATDKLFFPKSINDMIRLSSNYPPPERITTDCWLIRTKEGRFYLCVPMDDPGVNNQDPKKRTVIALDPGVRMFQTGYSVDQG